MGDLRELKEQTETSVRGATLPPAPGKPAYEAVHPEIIQAMGARIAAWMPGKLDEQAQIELVQMENAASVLELLAGPQASPALASLYRDFARLYASRDSARTRFYLNRSLTLAGVNSPLAPVLHYDLACALAANHNYAAAVRELGAAFEHRSKALDDRLAQDIEEGGELYRLAATPPYDKAVNDLLLNMSIGIG